MCKLYKLYFSVGRYIIYAHMRFKVTHELAHMFVLNSSPGFVPFSKSSDGFQAAHTYFYFNRIGTLEALYHCMDLKLEVQKLLFKLIIFLTLISYTIGSLTWREFRWVNQALSK